MGGGWLFLQRRRHPCQFPCLSLSCLIPPPSLQSPSSLAPALLMIPRQEAALAWGSKVISLVFLCRFLLFLCHCLSLKPSSLENQWHPLITISIKVEHERNWLEYQTLLCLYFFIFFCSIKICYRNHMRQAPTSLSTPTFTLDGTVSSSADCLSALNH